MQAFPGLLCGVAAIMATAHLPTRTAAGRVPPMGFNTYNAYGVTISEALIKKIADRLVATGLRDAGYT